MKPDAMDRGELLDRVMHSYRRFYMNKALFSYPWAGSGERRRYLLGCPKAFLKSGFERKFYDLGRVNDWRQDRHHRPEPALVQFFVSGSLSQLRIT